jgi:Na+-driven multidrug efflux pump
MGLGKGKDVFFLSMIRELIFLISLLILPRFLAINGAWISMPTADFFGFVIGGFWLFREYRRQKELFSRDDQTAETEWSNR